MKHNLLFITFLIFISLSANDKYAEINKTIYNNYIGNNIIEWKPVINELQDIYLQKKEKDALYLATLTIYGYAGYCIGNEMFDEVESYLELGENNIETMLVINSKWPEAWAFKAAFYGFRIGLSPYKAMYYGPISLDVIEQARNVSLLSSQVLLESANIKYYTPSIFGGSKQEALIYYKKSLKLMEANEETNNNWLYLSTLTQLALVYQKLGDLENAESVFLRLLKMEPEYLWVKNELYPQFLKLKNNQP